MPIFNESPPLSLYVHIPWCVRKCPYCDFNSHEAKGRLPEAHYVQSLMLELDHHLPLVEGRPLISIFFGGGTPSLFSGQAIGDILAGALKRMPFAKDIEITLEANPGTIDLVRFQDFRAAGINRLSLGVQSLQPEKLQVLGRIHDRDTALKAIDTAKQAGFDNFNIDLMFGLPNQSIEDALSDLRTAIQTNPTHLSWYQLTIEPNTVFYKAPPVLPQEDLMWEMQTAGVQLLSEQGFLQYEVSAYSKPSKQCLHNLNYWKFGDYLGIGAGAHSKITDIRSGHVSRFAQVKQPRDYLDANKRVDKNTVLLNQQDLIFEFMLNALRLTEGVPISLFSERTGLARDVIAAKIKEAKVRGLLMEDEKMLCPTELGKRFLNDLVGMFLP